MLSIIIPARNEADNLEDILDYFKSNLTDLEYELIIINDFSDDNTLNKAQKLFEAEPNFRVINNDLKGLGGAINQGIKNAKGDRVAITMADLSDSVEDLIKYNNLMVKKDLDSVLGSRFLKGSVVKDYPLQKLILNRIFNFTVSLLFWNKYNDYTNAFKIYKKNILLELIPLVSESFNIFLEIPLKVISRNYKYEVIPIDWYGRKKGKAKFQIKELRSKYLFTLLYCFIEKNLLNFKK